jgi:hypothetical protein
VLRRTFLCASVLSVAGTVKALATPVRFLPLQQQWLAKYLTAVGARLVNHWLAPDQDLNRQLQTASASFIKSGYRALGTTHYYCNNDQVAVFPLALHAPETGMIDLAALFFTKNTADHLWNYTHTFSGFDLEAVGRAMEQLGRPIHEQQALDQFVPVYEVPHQRRPFTFRTASGMLQLKVTLDSEKIWLDVKVVEYRTTLLAIRFVSNPTPCTTTLLA